MALYLFFQSAFPDIYTRCNAKHIINPDKCEILMSTVSVLFTFMATLCKDNFRAPSVP